jgi:type I restriction enzyme S subunit
MDMFGDPVKNEKGWEVKRLNNLLLKGEKISYGVVQPGDEFPNGVPIVRVGDFNLMKIDKTNLKRINPEIEKTYNRTRLKGDEILIACVGSVGKIALADESLKGFNIVRATAKVRVDENIINRKYLAFHLSQKSIQNYFVAETRTSSQPTLNIKQIEETKILVPPVKIQNQFNLISDDLLKQTEMVYNSNSDNLFQTLLQKAFKGELVH